MIKFVCDMCGEELPREEVVSLSFDGELLHLRCLHFDLDDLHLCMSCATRAYNWITNRGEGGK